MKEKKMSVVRIGIIGVGVMGSAHVRSVGQLKNCKLTALCDIDPQALERQKESGAELFSDSEALFESGKVDAVIISTPHYSHVPLALRALERGLHVLVEKPVAVQKSEAARLVAAAKAHPELKLSAMFCLRRIPTNIKIKQLIDSGELGAIRRVNWIITDWFRTQTYYNSGTWRATWAGEGGGVLLNQCPHQLDLMQWFFGMPATVTAKVFFGKYHDIEVEDEVSAIFEYPDGKTGVFVTSTGEAPGTNRLEIAAERGRLVLENGKLSFLRNEIPMSEFCRTSKTTMSFPDRWNIDIPVNGTNPTMHRDIIENFAEAILHDTPLYAPAAEGINSLELGNAMLLSQLKGSSVSLPLKAEEFGAELEKLIANSRKGKRK